MSNELTPSKKSSKGIFKAFTSAKIFSSLLVLALILLFNLVLQPDFFSIQILDGHLFGQLIDILNRAIPVMILAMGMTLVIATGGTDMSVGSVMAICGSLAISLIRGNTSTPGDDTAMPFILVTLITLAVGAVCGLWNGFLVAKIGMQPVVATLILMVAGRGAAQLLLDGRTVTTKFHMYSVFGQGWFLGLPVAVFVALGLFLLFWFFTRRTAFGLFVESVGINKSAANYSGIKATAIIIIVYVLAGICASISGMLYTSNLMIADANNIGLNYELDAILSVVLGGTNMSGGKFYLGGSCVGALILMALTKTMYSFNVAPENALVVKALVVIIIVFIQSPTLQNFVNTKFAKKEVSK